MVVFLIGVLTHSNLEYDVILTNGNEIWLKKGSYIISLVIPCVFLWLTFMKDRKKYRPLSSLKKLSFIIKKSILYPFVYIAMCVLINGFGYIILHSFANRYTISKISKHVDEKTKLIGKKKHYSHGDKYEFEVKLSRLSINTSFLVFENQYNSAEINDSITIGYYLTGDGSICLKPKNVFQK